MFTLAYYSELFTYSISAFFFPFYLTFHCSGNNSLVHACFAPTSFLKIGYYVGLEDFLHFSKKCTVIILYVNSHQELKLLKAFV